MLLEEDELGDGAGDVEISLEFRNSAIDRDSIGLEAGITFHIGHFGPRLSMSLWLKMGSYKVGGLRCRNVSISQRSLTPNDRAPLQGRLQDGRLYMRIPFFLFVDDFSTAGGRGGSSGGCYYLPLIMPAWARRGVHSVRAIGLSPPGVSSNTTLYQIAEDIVKCGTSGAEVEFTSGRKVVIFGELVGVLGDYPGEAHALDVMGPTATAPCTLCTFQSSSFERDDDYTRYAYTTSVHSGDPSFRRTKRKMRIIRQKANNVKDLQSVGLQALSDSELQKLPLHHISNLMDSARGLVPFTETGQPVVNFDFDPYQNTFVGPSHLFYGLGQNIMEAMIRYCTPEQRGEVDTLLFTILCGSGVLDEGSFIHPEKTKLNNMTISSTLAVLIVAPWAFSTVLHLPFGIDEHHSSAGEDTQSCVFRALYLFTKLLYSTVYLPSAEVDGLKEVQRFDKDDGEERQLFLRNICVKYVQTINKLCRDTPALCPVLDKPNVHRLVELYMHSIPRLGHVKTFDELQFEAFHQPLKRALARSNHHNGHVYSMRMVIANEWRSRMGDAAREVSSIDFPSPEDCELLMRAASGNSGLLREGHITCDDVRSAFNEAALAEFKSFGKKRTLFAARNSVWDVLQRSRVASRTPYAHQLDSVDTAIRVFLLQVVGSGRNHVATVDFVNKYETAVRYTVTNADPARPLESQIDKGRFNKINALSIGEIVQTLCTLSGQSLYHLLERDGVQMLPISSDQGEIHYWMVLGIYQVRNCPFVYVQVTPMQKVSSIDIDSGGTTIYSVSKSNATVLLQLTSGCVKALMLHCCRDAEGSGCTESRTSPAFNVSQADITSSSLYEHRWCILGSRDGFPPRSG